MSSLPHFTTVNVDPVLLHRRLAHCGIDRLSNTIKHAEFLQPNVNVRGPLDNFSCEACHIAKAKRQVSRDTPPRSSHILDLFYADTQTIKPQGFGGYLYYLIIINDKYRTIFIKFLHKKAQASEELIKFSNWTKNNTGFYPRRWRLDGGNEFRNYINWGEFRGIQFEITPPRTPESNGPPERYAGYINQSSRALILDARLPPELWPFAIETSVYVINRMISSSNTKSSLQLWREELNLPNPTTSLHHIRVWGSKAYRHIPQEDRVQAQKMDPRAMVGHLVGYEGEHGHLFKVWVPSENRVFRSRDVYIDEDDDNTPSTPTPAPPKNPNDGGPTNNMIGSPISLPIRRPEIHQNNLLDQQHIQQPQQEEVITGRVHTITPDLMVSPPPAEQPSIESPEQSRDNTLAAARRNLQEADNIRQRLQSQLHPEQERRVSTRTTKGKSPERYGDISAPGQYNTIDLDLIGMALPDTPINKTAITIPENYSDAINSPQKDLWHAAMSEQIKKLQDNNTWITVKKPQKPTQILPGKWVYDLKTDNHDNILEFRARWVVCGNFQRKTTENTWSPVVNDISLKLFLTYCAKHNYVLAQADIVAAFLNALLHQRTIYVMQPTGFIEDLTSVCLLQKALYGLRESASLWHNTIDNTFRQLGLQPFQADPCAYIHPSTKLMILLYVDDTLLGAPNTITLNTFLDKLEASYGLKRLGTPTKFLGYSTTRLPENKTIFLHQTGYAKELLARFDMHNSNGRLIPLNPGHKLNDHTTTNDFDPHLLSFYQAVAGSLNWLNIKTRPDFTFAIRNIQTKLSSPTSADMAAAKGILRYLKAFPDLGILLNVDPSKGLEVFTDASFSDYPDGKSSQGWIIYYAGAPISWATTKQNIVAPSSTTAEYICLGDAAKQSLFIQRLLFDFGLEIHERPVNIYTDSNNAVTAIKRHALPPATKWLNNRYHFIRDLVQRGDVKLHIISSKENPADGFTKPKDLTTFTAFRNMLHLSKSSS